MFYVLIVGIIEKKEQSYILKPNNVVFFEYLKFGGRFGENQSRPECWTWSASPEQRRDFRLVFKIKENSRIITFSMFFLTDVWWNMQGLLNVLLFWTLIVLGGGDR